MTPLEKAAHDIGAKGSEPTEDERLAFEAWMRGHCWAVIGDWDGKQYVHAHESTGFVHGGAMNTRQLWAAWRDRGALARITVGVQQVPMTPDEALDLMPTNNMSRTDALVWMARAVERHHGIGAKPVAQQVAVPTSGGEWRKLALQFDGHRMQALGHLRAMTLNPNAHMAEAMKFLAAPPEAQQVAVPAQCEPLSGHEISKWWASENDLEDCDMCIHGDFEKVVRAVEARHDIGVKPVAQQVALPTGCHRSHPHEEMNEVCTLKTEVAQLKAAFRKSKTELIKVAAWLALLTPLRQMQALDGQKQIGRKQFGHAMVLTEDALKLKAIEIRREADALVTKPDSRPTDWSAA